eukprot:5383807-Prymnesium_polylepis.1
MSGALRGGGRFVPEFGNFRILNPKLKPRGTMKPLSAPLSAPEPRCGRTPTPPVRSIKACLVCPLGDPRHRAGGLVRCKTDGGYAAADVTPPEAKRSRKAAEVKAKTFRLAVSCSVAVVSEILKALRAKTQFNT